MTKLLTALMLAAVVTTTHAESLTPDEIHEHCRIITEDKLLRAEVNLYVKAMRSGWGEAKAEQFAFRYSNRAHYGSTFGLRNPVFNGYINDLGNIKNFDEAMNYIYRQCEKHLRTL